MVSAIIIIALLGVLGYLLGIIGFFRAGAALNEVRELKNHLAQDAARRAAGQAQAAPRVAPAAAYPKPVDPKPLDPKPLDPEPVDPEPVHPVPAKPDAPKPEAAKPIGPPPLPIPAPQAKPTAAGDATRKPDFESVLTMRWSVWLGAVALLFAGVFLIRYAAEQGLLGPATRCCAAALLGAALLGAAAWLQRRDLPPIEGPFSIDQAPGALAAGGVAILFGAAYGVGPFYALVPPLVAFAAMAAVSVLGLLAALRFGPLTAAVGIVGAFVAPALVSTDTPSLISLFAYLAFATAGAHAVVRRTAWTWLGWAVTIAGAIWVLVAASLPPNPGIWAAATFVPLSALLGLLLPPAAIETSVGRRLTWGQFATIAFAGTVLESMAPGNAARAALFALSPLAIWKGVGEPRLDRLPWLAAACGLAALWFWNGSSDADPFHFFQSAYDDHGPETARTVLGVAFIFAAAYAAFGLWLETRAPHPTRWSALVAAVPVLALALCYAKIGHVEADIRWGLTGLLLALLLTASTYRAMGRHVPDQGGVHAAGAVAALALSFAMTMHDQWLTTALSLMLPGLAWIESKVELKALRVVAIVVAITTLVLLPNWILYDLNFGHETATRSPFVTYAIPAAAFALAAHIFRRGKDDTLVGILEAGAMATAALFVTLEIRLWFGHGRLDAPFSFDETATLMLAAAAQAFGYHRIALRARRKTVLVARGLYGALAYAMAVGLLIANPMLYGTSVSALSLILAYLVPALLAAYVRRLTSDPTIRALLLAYAVAGGFAWLTLQVRHYFHPDAMSMFNDAVVDAELWLWSGAWLVYGLAIMILGVRIGDRVLRLVALALIGLVCGKVFLVDTAQLTGLWRVASFLGLGLALIGLGAVHRRYVLPSWQEDAKA